MVCVKCKANIPDNVKFCPRCGAKIEVQAEEKPSEKPIEIEEPKDVLVCPKCGTANPKSAKFCRKDGTPLIAGVVYPKAEAEKEIGRRPSRVWLWLIIFVLVLGAVGIGGYFYLPRFIGAKPKIVQEKINTELRENELGNILVEVSKEWVATVSGSVPSQNEKKVVLNIVRSHKKVKEIIDNISISPASAELEKAITSSLRAEGINDVYAKVDSDLVITLRGYVNNQDEKAKVLSIIKTYGELKNVIDNVQVNPPLAAETSAIGGLTPQQGLLAQRAAQVVAYRNLSEMVYGVAIDAKTTVRDFVTQDDLIRSKTEAWIQGAKVIDTRFNPDGTCEVDIEVYTSSLPGDIRLSIEKAYGSRIEVTGSGTALPK